MTDTILTIFLVEVEYYFGVAACAKSVAALQQQGSQGLMVVDFAIADNPKGLVLVGNGLMPTLQIDNGETNLAYMSGRIRKRTAVIGAAVTLRIEHAL
jgi:hypothetical protein